MPINDPKIRLTLELGNDLYRAFNTKTSTIGASHIKVIRRLVALYVQGKIDLAKFPEETSTSHLRKTS